MENKNQKRIIKKDTKKTKRSSYLPILPDPIIQMVKDNPFFKRPRSKSKDYVGVQSVSDIVQSRKQKQR
jgi:hypothetical protein